MVRLRRSGAEPVLQSVSRDLLVPETRIPRNTSAVGTLAADLPTDRCPGAIGSALLATAEEA